MKPPDKTPYNPLGLVPDANNEVECPDCRHMVNLGSVGLPNYYKRHQESAQCRRNKEKGAMKRRKEKDESWKVKGRETVLNFFTTSQSKPVPSTVTSPPIIPPPPAKALSTVAKNPAPHEEPAPVTGCPVAVEILKRLQQQIARLPPEIPEADEEHPLAQFAGDYDGCIQPDEDAWEVFDPRLNGVLQCRPDELRALVCRGKYGLPALYRVLSYLVSEHAIVGALIESKVERILKAMDEVIAMPTTPSPSWEHTTDGTSTAKAASSATVLGSTNPPANSPSPTEIIEIDDGPDETPPRGKRSHPCAGIFVDAPAGSSIHTSYPFGIHDEYGDPWNYRTEDGRMTIYARACLHQVLEKGDRCRECQVLTRSTLLAGVLKRMEEGVHENTRLTFHSLGSLAALARRKTLINDQLRLKKLNDARKLTRQASTLEEHKKWILAIASGKVERVERLVRVAVKAKAGIRGLIRKYNQYQKRFYKTKTYTEEERLQGLIFLRMGGARVACIAHKALGLPSIRTLQRMALIPAIVASPYKPTVAEVEKNTLACFGPIREEAKKRTVVHQVLMVDEIKVEERPRWDDKTNMILGIGREHSNQLCLEFTSEHEVQMLMEDVLNGEVHLAVEATVGALGLLSADTRLYSARPVLVSGSCKHESGEEHAEILQVALEGSKKSEFRTVCISSDGESRRAEALVRLTFKYELKTSSPIYNQLFELQYMNLQVGDDDVTADKDQKHIVKRLRNLLLRSRGFRVHGIDITQGVLRSHLLSASVPLSKINTLLKPDDKQDVKLAYDLLKEIWSLPPPPSSSQPGFIQKHEAIHTMGSLFQHIVLPYICVDLSLTEQLTHLSTAAHMLLAMLREDQAGAKLMPTQLYIDIMIMIKNVYFCVAKAKVDNPESEFYLILLGTDRLEELFGILRTMVGNDTNLDLLQLASRLTSTTEVSDILAKFPEWDRGPRRLKLPPLSKDGFDVHEHVDHIHPPTWRGDVRVATVNLKTAWRLGRQLFESEHDRLSSVLNTLEQDSAREPPAPKVDLLRPFGADIVNAPQSLEDIDDTREDFAEDMTEDNLNAVQSSNDKPEAETLPGHSDLVALSLGPSQALEDAAAEDEPGPGSHDPCFEMDGKKIYKARLLNQMFRDLKTPGSRDRLKRVANIPRYAVKQDSFADSSEAEVDPETDFLSIDAPIASHQQKVVRLTVTCLNAPN